MRPMMPRRRAPRTARGPRTSPGVTGRYLARTGGLGVLQPLHAEAVQHGGQGVGEGDPAAGAPALGGAGEQQPQRSPVAAAPDDRAAVTTGAEGPGEALDLDLVV